MPKPEKGFREIDFRAGFNALVSILITTFLCNLIPGADKYLNVCVLAICAAFITEPTGKSTWQSGVTRCIVLGIGTVIGFIVVFLDNLIQLSSPLLDDLVLAVIFGVFTVILLVVEKMTGRMYIQCKIGIVAMVLTVYTFRGAMYAQMGKTCYGYGIMFFVSNVIGVLASSALMFLWDAVKKSTTKK